MPPVASEDGLSSVQWFYSKCVECAPLLVTDLLPLELSFCILKLVNKTEEEHVDEEEIDYSVVFFNGLKGIVKNRYPDFMHKLSDMKMI